MKLLITTDKILDLFQAFNRLDGYERAVDTHQGTRVIVESYDLSPAVKMFAATNRRILRGFKEAFEEKRQEGTKRVLDFRDGLDPKLEAKDFTQAVATFKRTEDAALSALGAHVNEVDGLMKLPGGGIRIRARDPGIIALLDILTADFIEGEPDYGQPKTPAKPARDD